MNKEQSQKFESLLNQQRNHLETVLSIQERELPVSSDEPMDEIDVVNAQIMNRMFLDLHERKFRSLQKVRAALHRIEKGAFGDCLACGDEIEIKRLEAMPTAPLCLFCQHMGEVHGQSYFQAVR
jgi:DnaK suppressor protein